ncbi:MAG: ribosome small subunit-dependent GTPase A [Bacillota bacterium]|nr:ribosome small subunit-dependent GTPase A [Bacillota bacterium]
MMKQGIVLKGIGGFYYTDTEKGIYECRARGKFRLSDISPLPGDHVIFEAAEDKTGYLMEILPRKNELVRPAVANVDNLFIVASTTEPVTDPFLVDKISAIAIHSKIRVILCVNKSDLDPSDEFCAIYAEAGFDVIRTSAVSSEGLDDIKRFLPRKVSVFTGNSGVGKSSLINLLFPEMQQETGSLSERIGRGRHTTRKVELFKLYIDSYIADTPGFSAFDLTKMNPLNKEDLENAFPEFSAYLGKCRFSGCSHVKEKGCAVLKAISEGRIAKSRHESYVRLLGDIKSRKEWAQ